MKPPISWEVRLHWIFRLAVCMEFVGHGAFGILTKKAWIPYITFWGIPEHAAWLIMPVIGCVDISLGLYSLFFPRRFVFAYMAVWGLFTAGLRPLTGESFFELIERSYNYGMPLAFLVLHGAGTSVRSWIEVVRPPSQPLTEARRGALQALFRAIVVMMLIGHGGYGLVAKAGLKAQYTQASWLGLPAATLLVGIGMWELVLAALACVTNAGVFLGAITLWKLASEGLHFWAKVQSPHWELIERGGAYLAPVALITVLAARMGREVESTIRNREGTLIDDSSRNYVLRSARQE